MLYRNIPIYIYKMITKLLYGRKINGAKNALFSFCFGIPSQFVKNPKQIYIGKNFFIGKDFLLAVYSENGVIEIGNDVSCQQRVRISAVESVCIGDDVLMASDVFITDNNHGMNVSDSVSYQNQRTISSPVTIGDGCWIGEKCIILPGVNIGKKSIIGAGSVVTKSIPDFSMAVGNPARVIKKWDFNTMCWEKI